MCNDAAAKVSRPSNTGCLCESMSIGEWARCEGQGYNHVSTKFPPQPREHLCSRDTNPHCSRETCSSSLHVGTKFRICRGVYFDTFGADTIKIMAAQLVHCPQIYTTRDANAIHTVAHTAAAHRLSRLQGPQLKRPTCAGNFISVGTKDAKEPVQAAGR